jgi:glucosamine-phosphate N-acetyltransferase
MTVRDFRVADFKKGLLESLGALSETAFAGPSVATHFARLRRKRGVRTFVAVEVVDCRQVVVGTCSVFVEPKFIHGGSWVGHVEDVAVHPDWQGKGVGTALVRHAIAHCKSAGCYKVVLYCAPEVVPFYERVGFYHNGSGMRLDLADGGDLD